MNSRRIATILSVLSFAGQGVALGQTSGSETFREGIRSDPYPLGSIIKFVHENKKYPPNLARTYEKVFISRITKVGIAFPRTDDNIAEIRNAGGSEELIAAIQNAKAPEQKKMVVVEPSIPEPPPIRLRTGILTINCQPAECTVLVNGGL